MKQSIDLTENMDFSERRGNFAFHDEGSKIPWRATEKHYSYFQDWNPSKLIITGNKSYIKSTKMVIGLESGYMCACCGRTLLPYSRETGLCGQCSDMFDENDIISSWQ